MITRRNPPRRILILKPCCIGDVIFATPLLSALKRGYPEAAIDWAVGSWSAAVLSDHPLLDRVLDTGSRANPASAPRSLWQLIRMMRAGRYDLLVVPDRSRWLSLAALLSGIPVRVGLDSGGRGFGYTLRVPINPLQARHEADIYLDLARTLTLSTADCWANVGINAASGTIVEEVLAAYVPPDRPLVIVHPGGGVNPGMNLTAKRWPVARFGELSRIVAEFTNGLIIVLGSVTDRPLASSLCDSLAHFPGTSVTDLSGVFDLPQIAALAALPRTALYIGNDNGIAHLAAAAGAKVLMIFGPSDPHRYAPFVAAQRAAVAWRPVSVPAQGVTGRQEVGFDWVRDGVSVAEAWQQAEKLLGGEAYAKK